MEEKIKYSLYILGSGLILMFLFLGLYENYTNSEEEFNRNRQKEIAEKNTIEFNRQLELNKIKEEERIKNGQLRSEYADKDESIYQQLWRSYYDAIAIQERLNPRKRRQDMPLRYWKYLTEMK